MTDADEERTRARAVADRILGDATAEARVAFVAGWMRHAEMDVEPEVGAMLLGERTEADENVWIELAIRREDGWEITGYVGRKDWATVCGMLLRRRRLVEQA